MHDIKATVQKAEGELSPVLAFAQKVGDDAVTVNAGALAYSLLFSMVPRLVGLLGLVGWGCFLVGHSPRELTRWDSKPVERSSDPRCLQRRQPH